MQFSKRLDRFGEEIFAALNNRRMELEAQGMKIYNMSVGTPDFKTPEHIKKALAAAAMDDNNWKYSLRDLPELLEAVCTYYKKRFDVNLTPDMVMTVYGSQEGMGHLGMALCDEGDVVLLPDPCYPVFAAGSLMAGAVPYYYPLVAEHDFLPYVKNIPEEVAKKAKYMVVSLPSNPVGSIATPGLYEDQFSGWASRCDRGTSQAEKPDRFWNVSANSEGSDRSIEWPIGKCAGAVQNVSGKKRCTL